MALATLSNFNIIKYYQDHKFFIISILDAVKAQNWDYEISKPCCCNLGKDLKSHEGKLFTQHPAWHKAHALHNELHRVMESYFLAAKSNALEKELKIIRDHADSVSYQLMQQFEAVIEAFGAEKIYLKQLNDYRSSNQKVT